ncbi:MAG: hypothetical protein ACOX7F_08720 [Eubacteriales bacterium]
MKNKSIPITCLYVGQESLEQIIQNSFRLYLRRMLEEKPCTRQ